MSIPEQALPEDASVIPAQAAALGESFEAPEAQPYLISFKRYKDSECQLFTGAVNVYAMDALKSIKSLGTELPMRDASNRYFGVPTVRVHNANEYANLFTGIDDPEIDMREVKLSGKERTQDHRNGKQKTVTHDTGRIFFYPVDQIIYIVAIRGSHYETSKR